MPARCLLATLVLGVLTFSPAVLTAAEIAPPVVIAVPDDVSVPAIPAVSNEIARPISERFAAAEAGEIPHFQRHVLPLLGRLGCNGRACHGSFQGQGGLRLSLFGYDFKQDHEALTTGEAPRVDVEVAAESLMLQKPTLGLPHKGGRRMEADGWEYRVLARWIAAGAPGVVETDRRFERLEVTPTQILFDRLGGTQQVRVVAHWSDGSAEDVTPLCRFRTNNESVSEVDANGLVTSIGAGDTDIVVFYDNGVAPVQTLLPVSDQVGPNYPAVPTPTRIDELVVQKLRLLGIVPSDVARDHEFLRRVSLDMTGTLPTPAEVRAFLADTSSDKRAKKIDELLERPAYAAWWATRLCDITGNNPQTFEEKDVQAAQSYQWFAWLENRVRRNVPYDQIVEGMVVSHSRRPGQDYDQYVAEMGAYYRQDHPVDYVQRADLPLYWARSSVRMPDDKALGFAYTFLGVRLQCAQCHKHPFDQWTQDDFKEFAAFFGRVQSGTSPDAREQFKTLRTAVQGTAGKDKKLVAKVIEEGKPYPWREVFVAAPVDPQRKVNPKRPRPVTLAVTARFLGGEDVELKDLPDPRVALMAWMRERGNPYFARAIVNRVWADYFGLGIVDPPDDLNLANPPSNPALLDYLAQAFVAHGYDLKWLHREIANSRTYQLSWEPNATNRQDARNFSHAVPRRLAAEVAYDALRQVTATEAEVAAAAADPSQRAISQSPGSGKARRGNANYALTVFGKPARATNCDCERSAEPTLLQTIFLRNDREMLDTIERSSWLREIVRTPRGGDRKPRDRDAPATPELIAKSQQKLEKFRSQGDEVRVAQLERRIKQLQKELEKQGQQPAGAPAPQPAAQLDAQIATATLTPDQFVEEAYLRTVSRMPSEVERARAKQYLSESADLAGGMRDLLWSLMNTKEFIVNH